MKVVSSVLFIVTSHPRKSVTSPRLFINVCWCALAGLVLLPAAFRAWSAECVLPPAGLVSWWSGEWNADDSVGLAGGTLYGGVTFAPGRVGQCFAFDGVGGVVNVSDLPALALTNSLTIECWLFVTNAPSTVGMVILRGDTRPGLDAYTVYVAPGAGGSAEVGFTVTDASNHGIAIASVMPTGDWTHVAATLDDVTGLMSLYTNGVVADQTTTTIRPLAPLDPNYQAGVGIGNVSHQPSVFNYPFRGRIDELSVYSRAISATEVQAIYNAGSAGKCGSAPTPHAATAMATVVNGFVVGATITDGGWGYTNTPGVKILGAGGSGAQAVALVSNGVVIAVTVLNTGNGYTNTPVVVIEPPFIPQPTMSIKSMSLLSFTNLALGTNYQFQVLVGNTWSNLGAAFTATGPTFTQYVSGTADPSRYHLATTPLPLQAHATAQRVNGFIVGATVTSGGSGYVTNPAVTIVGGGGTNATAISHISAGRVTSITITVAGIGYTSTPTIQIAPPPPGIALSPTVLPVARLDSASLAPYENYQIQFKPNLGGVWENWSGGLFSPTDVTNSQYLFITNAVDFFRLQYVP
jgi:hypothetical protein